MVLDKKAYAAKTTYSKWEKDGLRRVYLNSPVLRWYKVTLYYDGGAAGFTTPHQAGKLSPELLALVNRRFSEYLNEKGVVTIPDLDCDDWHLHFEQFNDLWAAL